MSLESCLEDLRTNIVDLIYFKGTQDDLVDTHLDRISKSLQNCIHFFGLFKIHYGSLEGISSTPNLVDPIPYKHLQPSFQKVVVIFNDILAACGEDVFMFCDFDSLETYIIDKIKYLIRVLYEDIFLEKQFIFDPKYHE